MSAPRFDTREAWLLAATDRLRESLFKRNLETIPVVRVSVGFPGGKSPKKVVGQCWHPKASDDGVSQVFISPVASDAVSVLDTLVHELIHAIKPDAGHRAAFKRIALKVGLTGKMKSTVAGAELKAELEALAAELGAYPHAKINLDERKKQTTRGLKAMCGEGCGDSPEEAYCVRITRKWVDSLGAPICPGCEVPMQVFEAGASA